MSLAEGKDGRARDSEGWRGRGWQARESAGVGAGAEAAWRPLVPFLALSLYCASQGTSVVEGANELFAHGYGKDGRRVMDWLKTPESEAFSRCLLLTEGGGAGAEWGEVTSCAGPLGAPLDSDPFRNTVIVLAALV